MKINLNSIKKIKLDNKKMMLIGLVAAFFLYLDYNFVIIGQLKNINTVRPRIVKIKNDMRSLNKELGDISSLKSKQIQPSALNKTMISEQEVTGLLEQISNLANKNKVRIMQIKPAREAKAKEEKSLQGAKLAALYITLELFGAYHNFGSFINDIENADKFIAVSEIRFKRDEKDYVRQSANLMLKTYVKK